MINTFTIKARLPSLNEYIAACRKHPQMGAKLKRDSQDVVIWHIRKSKSQRTLQAILKPCVVNFDYYERTARRDLDNISSMAHKIILDALVEEKILPNDTQKWVTGFTDTFYRGSEDCIIVTIKELDS